jgi:hypothetical protein
MTLLPASAMASPHAPTAPPTWRRTPASTALRRRGWRGPAGSGWRSRGRPVRGSATTDAPLCPPRQVRPRSGIATAGPGPGRPARGTGKRGKAPRASCAAGRVREGGPALPEGKAGRGGRGVVPGGDLVRALAVAGGGGSRPGCRPTGQAGLPPRTAGIQPPLRPARCRGGLDTPPRATRRYGPTPAQPGGDGPAPGPAAERVPRRGHGGAHRDGCCGSPIYLACTFLVFSCTWGCLSASPGRRTAVVC